MTKAQRHCIEGVILKSTTTLFFREDVGNNSRLEKAVPHSYRVEVRAGDSGMIFTRTESKKTITSAKF